MRARVLGQGPLARALAERLGEAGPPELVVDARVALEEKAYPADLPLGLPVLTLVWGHSATLARTRYPQASEVVGFSLVPPLEPGRLAELSAPLGEAVPAWARGFFAALGYASEVIPDQAGGVGFRVLAMLANEAASALAEGVGDEEGIDRAMRLGTRYPRGPFAWARALGLPELLAGLEGLFSELGEDRYRPDPLLKKAAAVGKWR
jgi:3-hydroxyacyl-CoA dehydrogenase